NGIFYIDVGFNLKGIEQKYIPYIPLIAKALIEIGTKKQDYVKIGQRIGQHTGGIRRHILVDQVREEDDSCFWLFLRGKSLISKVSELMDIMRELILDVNLDNKDRFLQLVLEEKARFEKNLLPSGHDIVARRICADLSESGWLEEKTKGISYLFFLRRLSELIKSNWDQVYSDIIRAYEWIINRKNMLINITCPQNEFERHEKEIDEFIYAVPDSERKSFEWKRETTIARPEALLIKAKVNFVGKGASLYRLGYKFHGSSLVITRYLRNTWLWDSIRVQGGAYGAHCIFDRLSGDFVFVSYRDPNIKKTIESYDKSSDFLKNIELSKRELTKAIIRTIADIDAPLLPDAKGFRSMRYYLTKDTEDVRQKMREEVLETQVQHFREFSDVLFQVKEKGIIKVMGPEENVAELKKEIKELNQIDVMK
ncbi:MAG: peptidase M16, partial [Deltaproteobacteria bacterium]